MFQNFKDGYPLAGQSHFTNLTYKYPHKRQNVAGRTFMGSEKVRGIPTASQPPSHTAPLLHSALYSWDWNCANSTFQPPLLAGFLFGCWFCPVRDPGGKERGVIRKLGENDHHSAAGSGTSGDCHWWLAGTMVAAEFWGQYRNQHLSNSLSAGLGASFGRCRTN